MFRGHKLAIHQDWLNQEKMMKKQPSDGTEIHQNGRKNELLMN